MLLLFRQHEILTQVAQRATIAHLRTNKYFLNSSQVSKRFFQLVKGSQLCSPWLDKILRSIKGRNSVANLQKWHITIST